MTDTRQADFAHLTPETVLNAVEDALGLRCTNICRPLNSYINRVFEVGLADGGFVIAKFYRPSRWSDDALQDELDFLAELDEAEVPVVPPQAGRDGALLHRLADTRFAIFPKRGGRPLDEPDAPTWTQLGRLLARLHAVGQRHPPRDRIVIHPARATRGHLAAIREAGALHGAAGAAYERTVLELVDLVTPAFDGVGSHRVHGDCHRANILHRPGEGFHLLDFDDMGMGPAVQDLWMLLPDRVRNARLELECLLEGYETFLPFPRASLRLVEPLRAMRFVHYTAWCARQKADGGFARLAPGWGTDAYWRQETADLERQRQEILDAWEDLS